ncbi:MAG: 3-beta hydroxysteroid dehydrogenase [Chitinophagaceae bacterium]
MVLVTGGTGFLGAYIIKNLVEKGHAVRAIRRTIKTPFYISQEIWNKVEWMEGDVLDLVSLHNAMQGVDGIIHAAAIVSFHKKDRHQLYETNVEGTANVVNTALENGIRRMIHVSSVAALGRTSRQELITEEKKWEINKNNTYYAKSKHAAEMHVWRAFAEGLEGATVNPSTILGFGDWHNSSCTIFKNAYNGFPWYTTGVNGFVGVEDAAEAIVQLYFSDINAKRFIINAENWSFQNLFNSICDGFGKKHPHLEATPFLGSIAWQLEAVKSMFNGKKPLLTKETARVAHSRTSFDNSALLQTLPHFSYTPLQTVIATACKKYLNAVEKGELSP